MPIMFYRLRFFFIFYFLSKGAPKNLFVTVGPFIYLYVLGNEQRQLEKIEKQEIVGLLTTYLKQHKVKKGKGEGRRGDWYIGEEGCLIVKGESLSFVFDMICSVVFWPFRI